MKTTNWIPKLINSQAGVLSKDVLQVWQADLDLSLEYIQDLYILLSEDERQRAQRFHFERDRRHFIVARGLLRKILSYYLNQPPDLLQFHYSLRGKPALVGEAVQFNVSHSQGKALYAIALNQRVGIDLEYIRPISILELAQRFFTAAEFQWLSTLSSDRQKIAFFQLWTYKEAYLKATGDGLVGLQQVEILLTMDQEVEHLKIAGIPSSSTNWFLQPLNLGDDFAASVAAEGKEWQLQCWQLFPESIR